MTSATSFQQRWLRPEQRRLQLGLLASLLVHGLLLSLSLSGQGIGLPGFEFPWQDRRIEVPELRVRLDPLPVPAAGPPPAEPPGEERPTPADEAAAAPWRAEAAEATEASKDGTPPPQRTLPDLIALKPTEKAAWVAPASPPVPAPVAASMPAAASAAETELPVRRDDAASEAARESERQEALRREAERLETARTEALRLDAERQEAARRAAAREEAARREAARLEAARAEAARLDAERQEAGRQLAARAEAARLETEQAERQAAARQQEAARQETARQEAEKREATREAARAASARETAARETAAQEKAAAETAALETAAREAAAKQAAAAAARLEATRQDAARLDAARSEAAQQETAREARLRAIGKQLNAEADRREASGNARRGRLFGRIDTNAELVLYGEAWARKIELNPTFDMVRELAKQPHADPLVTVSVRSDGSVESVNFIRSSGVPAIDEAIRRIVQSQANYPAFSPNLAREFDVVEIRRTWRFDSAIRLQ